MSLPLLPAPAPASCHPPAACAAVGGACTVQQYEPIIISCTLTGRVATYLGGHATVTLDKEHIVLYREDTNAPVQKDAVGGGNQHRVSFCTFPVYEAVDGERMREWIDIHK